MVALPIYLDNHATTRVDPRVVEAMLPYFTEIYGNPASVSHRFGWDAEAAVESARAQVAALIRADPKEMIFTSGATESNNLALKGAAASLRRRGNHLISAATEHRAVLDPLRHLAREGWEVTLVDPDPYGLVSVEAIAAAMTDRTVLVSVMAANNEVGTINPIREIGQLCRERGVLFHTDATQAVAKLPLDVEADHIDLLSLTAHKFHGPKGIGALYVRRRDPRVRLQPLIEGGGHERGLRSGTLAVPLIVGFGRAAEIALGEHTTEVARLRHLRDRLYAGLVERVPRIRLNGHPTCRLPNNLNLSFELVDGEALMMAMRDIAVSSGSACTSANPEPSHVLRAMGLDEDLARASLRFGIGRFNTEEEIDYAIERIAGAVESLRAWSADWSSDPTQPGPRATP
ncbi:MAG: cysteine desulfurase IscS [Isosphaeraceae bacterium]|jgi:cysteine desulfurase|nr:MAG: cysteine desulfurase IscS [Isosphaeraceae bacterium]